jgi:hypothetical protein
MSMAAETTDTGAMMHVTMPQQAYLGISRDMRSPGTFCRLQSVAQRPGAIITYFGAAS